MTVSAKACLYGLLCVSVSDFVSVPLSVSTNSLSAFASLCPCLLVSTCVSLYRCPLLCRFSLPVCDCLYPCLFLAKCACARLCLCFSPAVSLFLLSLPVCLCFSLPMSLFLPTLILVSPNPYPCFSLPLYLFLPNRTCFSLPV